jgi:hypothetical protein
MPLIAKGSLFSGCDKRRCKSLVRSRWVVAIFICLPWVQSGSGMGEDARPQRSPSRSRNKTVTSKKTDFRTFYRDAHAVTCLTDREKMLLGLAVAMMRLCDP